MTSTSSPKTAHPDPIFDTVELATIWSLIETEVVNFDLMDLTDNRTPPEMVDQLVLHFTYLVSMVKKIEKRLIFPDSLFDLYRQKWILIVGEEEIAA